MWNEDFEVMRVVSVDMAVELLAALISTPSISGEEAATATIIERFLTDMGASPRRCYNNVWAVAEGFDAAKPTLLLTSHHDTVKPTAGYTFDPFEARFEGGRLYGLGSNDAGASVVSLIALFSHFSSSASLPFNLVLAITAEEENMGREGMSAMLAEFERCGITISMAIVGEPTSMHAALGERGLVVLDGVTAGRSGHAARNEGENALYKAIEDIVLLRDFRFERSSEVLGDVKISVTQIAAGVQHNIVPAECRYVVDVRTTDAYSNEEVVAQLQSVVRHSLLTARSTRLQSSAISPSHPLVVAATNIGRESFISPTLSDRALMHAFPALKMGVGDSARSHTADEYIEISEIEEGIAIYISLIKELAGYETLE